MPAVTVATAQVDLQNWTRAYQRQRTQFEQMRKNVDTMRAQTVDNTTLVHTTAVNILSALGLQAASYRAALGAILNEFGTTVLNVADQPFSVNLSLFLRYLQDNSIELKSRGTVYGAAVDDDGNTGNQTLEVCGTDRLGTVIESANIETIRFECLSQSGSKQNLGREFYQVKGDGAELFNEFDGNGLQIKPFTITSIGPGRSTLLDNESFDLPFVSTGVAKIPGWDIVSGDSNIARDTTAANIAQDRGGTHAALKITGNCKLRFDFRKRSKTLSPFAPYIGGLRLMTDADTSATVTIRVGSAVGVYTVAVAPGDTSSAYTVLKLDPDSANAWLETFDTDGQPFFEIEVSGYSSDNLWIDDTFFEALPFVGGRPANLIGGLTPAVRGDKHTQACTLTVGSGSVQLTGGGSGSVDSITITQPDSSTVELLSEAVAFNTSLNQTATDVATEINENITTPQYVASASTDTVTITQKVPVEGTFTVTSTATTITTADTNITGASLGENQDSLVRNTGAYGKHAASATAGWEDPARFDGAS